MKHVRASVTLLGVIALGLGVATVLAPDLAPRLDVATAFPNDYLFVVPLGLAAATVVLGTLGHRSIRGIDQAAPPDPERVPTADAPGAEFDRLVRGGWRTAPAALRRRDGLYDRLREAALQTVIRAEGCSRDAALRRIEAGTWTDDPVAAAFLSGNPALEGRPARTTLAALLRVELPLQLRARRTARAIAGARGGDRA